MAKYDYIKLSKRTKLSEKELNALKNWLNNKASGTERNEVLENLYSTSSTMGAIAITSDQVAKGKKYLYNLGFTPKGAKRKNSPFRYWNDKAIENFVLKIKDIGVVGFYDAGNIFSTFYVPIYQVEGKDGKTMEYIVAGGEINIIG